MSDVAIYTNGEESVSWRVGESGSVRVVVGTHDQVQLYMHRADAERLHANLTAALAAAPGDTSSSA